MADEVGSRVTPEDRLSCSWCMISPNRARELVVEPAVKGVVEPVVRRLARKAFRPSLKTSIPTGALPLPAHKWTTIPERGGISARDESAGGLPLRWLPAGTQSRS
jgi:hypothetical protein